MNDQENIEESIAKMPEQYAHFYFHLAAEYLRTFGDTGKKRLCEAIRELGQDFGETIRKEHDRLGYSIDLYEIFITGNFMDRAALKCSQIDSKPDSIITEIVQCPLCKVWQKFDGMKEGVLYCKEIYPAICSAFEAKMKIGQSKMMSRGDSTCCFKVDLTSSAGCPGSDGPEKFSPEERLTYMQELWAKMYYYLGKGLVNNFANEGEAALRRAICRYGRERGKLMRQDHLTKGYDINVQSLINHYDLPVKLGLEHHVIESDHDIDRREILKCKYHDVWKTYPDGKEISRIYCEELHHAFWTAYDPALQVNLTTTLTQNDDRCRFTLYLRSANKVSEPKWIAEFEKQQEN